MLKSRKKAFMSILTIVLAVFMSCAVFADNHHDSSFNFTFSGGFADRTEFRGKTNNTSVYMKTTSVEKQFVAHVVGSAKCIYDPYDMGIDCSHGYTYTVSAPCVYRMYNWVHENSLNYAAIYAAPSYNILSDAHGVWSPDSI